MHDERVSSMIKPISCNHCKAALAWYDDISGQIVDEKVPEHIKIVAAWLWCMKCRVSVKFDGQRMRKSRFSKVMNEK
jgi:hypothetical protein